MIADYKLALANYDFLLEMLRKMTELAEKALKDDRRWFSFGPKIARKFSNQAYSLGLLFHTQIFEYPDGREFKNEDISSMFSVLRMQFETHAAFYHFFIPCKDIEENILRFRLWELDGHKARVDFKRDIEDTEGYEIIRFSLNYIPQIEASIRKLGYFNSLSEKQRSKLVKSKLWKFSSESLRQTDERKWGNSFNKLILNTGLKQSIHDDLYSYLSMHTHPQYIGVVQSQLNSSENEVAQYIAITNACFVTAFMIEDLAKRFSEPKEYLNKLPKHDFDLLRSISIAGRD